LSRSVDRHRVAVGFVDNHAVAVEPGACGGTTIVGEGWQASEEGALSFPHLCDRFGLPTDPALIILEACLKQVQVQILKRGHLWKRYHEVASRETDRCLHSTFLPSRTRLAE